MPPSVDDLIDYFRAGAKPRAQFRIGIEQEKIGIGLDGAPVPYGGAKGIEAILGRMEARGFAATREGRAHRRARARRRTDHDRAGRPAGVFGPGARHRVGVP
jgi:gamma-glutamylcysteine synthetase